MRTTAPGAEIPAHNPPVPQSSGAVLCFGEPGKQRTGEEQRESRGPPGPTLCPKTQNSDPGPQPCLYRIAPPCHLHLFPPCHSLGLAGRGRVQLPARCLWSVRPWANLESVRASPCCSVSRRLRPFPQNHSSVSQTNLCKGPARVVGTRWCCSLPLFSPPPSRSPTWECGGVSKPKPE